MNSIEELVQELRDRGAKVTPQRLEIYRVLDGNTDHPSADAVYEQVKRAMPTVSRTTVYTTLNELVADGQLKRFDVDGVGHFDPDTSPHAETVCLSCGAIADVRDVYMPSQSALAGFRVVTSSVTLHGYCRRCRKNQTPAERKADTETANG